MRFVSIAVTCAFSALPGCGDRRESEARISSRSRDVAKRQRAGGPSRTGGDDGNIERRKSPGERDPVGNSALDEFDGSVKSGPGTSSEDTTEADSLSKYNRAPAKSVARARYEPKRKFSGFSVRMDSPRLTDPVTEGGRMAEEPETSEMFDEVDALDSFFVSTVSGANSQPKEDDPNAVDGVRITSSNAHSSGRVDSEGGMNQRRTDFTPTYSHPSGQTDSQRPGVPTRGMSERRTDAKPTDSEGPVGEGSRKSSQNVKKTIVRSEVGPRDQEAGLRGIYNLGNTCYLNTLLQVLMHIEGVKDEMANLSPDIHSQLMRGFLNVLNLEWIRGPPMRPDELVRVLMNKHPLLFTPGRQQDAYEGFSVLLQDISEELRLVAPAIDEAVVSLFRFDLFSQLSCDLEDWRYSSHVPENTLSVAIPQDDSEHGLALVELVKQLFGDEPIDGMESCGGNLGFKRLAIAFAPAVFVVHLKRALLDDFGRSVRVDTKVRINEMVDAKSFLGIQDGANILYQLKTIAHHSGDGEGGHWYADFQHSEDSNWYRASDDAVSKLNRFESLSSTATLIVYERISN